MKDDLPAPTIAAWQIILGLAYVGLGCIVYVIRAMESDLFDSFWANLAYYLFSAVVIVGFVVIAAVVLRKRFSTRPNIIIAATFLLLVALAGLQHFWLDDIVREWTRTAF